MSLLARPGPDGVALVLVGDELLLGAVTDTNGAWLGRRLTQAGLRVVAAAHVPDDAAAIADAVRRALNLAPTVVVTGGLGPTSDDVTREALARVAGSPLVRDEAAAEAVRTWFARRGRQVPAVALRMAEVPATAALLGNHAGSAPGVRVELPEGVVYAVPGVPHEMRAMVDADVLPDALRRAGDRPTVAAGTLRVAVMGESWVAQALAGLEEQLAADGDASVAYLPSPGEIVVRVTVARPTAAAATSAVAGYLATAEELLGDVVAARDDATAADALVQLLAERQASVATAESLTAGAVAATLADAPGASLVLRGGVVAYLAEIKQSLLDVPREILDGPGVVSAECATAMAAGARRRFGAQWGVATTGVAGPAEHDGQPVGSVVIAVVGAEQQRVRQLHLVGGREAIRRQTVVQALDLLRRVVRGLGEPPRDGPGSAP
jgi:nicotinamide-nucleotide amidase